MLPSALRPATASSSAPILQATTAVAVVPQRPSRIKDSFAALAAQEKALQADPKWRKYGQLVERTLHSFDQVNEWADFITFLAKLLKCLQSYPQFQVIPHKLTVAKRLSQCLNPALPTGVHQRALDVYTHILTAIGPENLRRDLPAWSSGLFPFFQYAATSVKPIVLGIYERFYLPLQESLRPATKAFILALLPGLEEETGEFFEKVAALLDRVSGTVSPEFFFQNVWLVLVTAPNSRIPALNYLSRRLPKMQSDDSVSHIVGQDVGLMVRGFAAALEDPQILVQRGILDLLATTLKLDSIGFKSTRKEDQILLMRAVTGVVLRRDLSLSRRLYTWLLGSSDSPDTQMAHLREHGLDLLRSALKMDMDAQSSDTVDRQRPFKIFISLLDKWEIGSPLTEVLVLDAFAALQTSLRPNDDHDELLMTGNMLFEIIDPFLMWKQIYTSLRETITTSRSVESIALARFIIRTFRLHDEEVQKLHAPFVAFGILDLVETATRSPGLSSSAEKLTLAITFTLELLHEISPRFFETAPDSSLETPPEHLGLTLADALYEATDMKTASITETEGRELLTSAFVTTLRLAQTCAYEIASTRTTPSATIELLISTLSIVAALSEATSHAPENLRVAWNPEEWTRALVSCLNAAPASPAVFGLHAAIIRSILGLTKTPTLRPSLKKNNRILVESLTSKLLEYLQPSCASCFVESVKLLWGVEELSEYRLVESMISERLSSLDPRIQIPAYEAFGNLWRFTDDAQLPGMVLRTPMLMMLDSLKSEDLGTRRAGEAWMRCSLKSYLRILDPLLLTLLSPAIKQVPASFTVAGMEVSILVYNQTFDQARVHHILDDLLSLARFGGQGFIRIAKGAHLKHSLDPAFRERVRALDLETQTYLDGMITILLGFLRADPAPELVASLGPINYHIHSVVAELLQVIISRGESEISGLRSIESTLTSRLYLCIHRDELDLQNKLLHVLHSVVHAVSGTQRRSHKPSLSEGTTKSLDGRLASTTRDTMFVRVVSDAISLQSNSAVLHHWIDFLLITIPQFRLSLFTVIFPLIDCLVTRIRALVQDFKLAYSSSTLGVFSAEATDAEYTVLMNALERLLLMAISESLSAAFEEESKGSDKVMDSPSVGTPGGLGLLGYMSGVLGTTDSESPAVLDESKPRQATLSRLRDATNLLLFSWDVNSSLEQSAGSDSNNSQGYYASRIKVRARKALERIYKASTTDVLDDIILYWDKIRSTGGKTLAMVDILAPSPLHVVAMLCDKLSSKASVPLASDKRKESSAPPIEVTFAFFEAYLERMEGAIAVQVWTVCLSFVRDFLSNISISRPQIFSCLRIFTALSEKISQTSALEDRRMRRDLQETFIRLTDASCQLAGRAAEQTGWLRRVIAEGVNGDSDSIMSEKAKEKSELDEGDDERRPTLGTSQAHDITDFLARRVMPDFRRFLIDADKTVAACSNMVYYIIAPAFKTRSRTFEIDPAVFDLLIEMAKNPATLKSWRTQVGDAFADNRFFNATPRSHAKWKPLIQALMASDKERLVELSSKISSVSSANIFTNRELESLSRALSLRRLTYTIFTGDKNRFLTQLPLIQEKLVDLLRSSVGDMVHAEVYRCLRVLFCRVGHQHLAGLWPVILTELLRLFDSLVDHAVPDGSDLLQLILSACKFLDLTLVLQTEEFQIHEWMFVTDTVDAVYPPDVWLPQAIMDRVGEILTDPHSTLQPSKMHNFASSDLVPAAVAKLSHGRRPLLTARRIESMADLEPFFSRVSLSSYEAVYNSGGKVDWEAVERGLEREIFEGEDDR